MVLQAVVSLGGRRTGEHDVGDDLEEMRDATGAD